MIDKQTQDQAWKCAPKAFRNEVKRQCRIARNENQSYTLCTLEYLFGDHNLTSDSEPDEVLTVSRKKVQEIYKQINSLEACNAMDVLFGSKCLPDNVDSSESNVDSLAANVDSSDDSKVEPKPAHWTPQIGETIFCVNANFTVSQDLFNDFWVQRNRRAVGNEFKTAKEAEQVAEAVRKCLEQIQKDNQQ